MINITQQKKNLLIQIRELTHSQTAAITSKDVKSFLQKGDQKQQLIEKVKALDAQFESEYARIKRQSEQEDFAKVLSQHIDIKDVQRNIQEIQTIIDDIRMLEAENKEKYNNMLLTIQSSVQQAVVNKQENVLKYKRMNEYKKNKQ